MRPIIGAYYRVKHSSRTFEQKLIPVPGRKQKLLDIDGQKALVKPIKGKYRPSWMDLSDLEV